MLLAPLFFAGSACLLCVCLLCVVCSACYAFSLFGFFGVFARFANCLSFLLFMMLFFFFVTYHAKYDNFQSNNETTSMAHTHSELVSPWAYFILHSVNQSNDKKPPTVVRQKQNKQHQQKHPAQSQGKHCLLSTFPL